MKEPDPSQPLYIDTSALELGHFVVLQENGDVVREFDSLNAALSFIADIKAVDVGTVREWTKNRAGALGAYRDNIRNRRTDP